METDESRRGKDPAALSGGHLCHVCGYQYPNPHPSAKLRRSHRKHCKAPAAAAGEAVEEVEEAVAGGEGGAGARNAAERRTPLGGGGGGQREEIGSRETNGGGAALRGSAGGVDTSVEGKVTADHASPPCTGAQVITTELSENNCLINCSDNESASAEDTRTQIISGELSENALVNCRSKSIENVHEGNGTESQIACTNGNQTEVEHPAEREDSFDEFQDASPFLHQPDSEDGAAPSSVFSVEINNLKSVPSGSSVAANETSVETNELSKAQFSGEPNLRAEPEVNLKLEGSYGHSLNAPIDCSTELPTQNCTVENISDDQQPLENSCKKSLECPTAGFQYDLPGTNVDDIPITNVSDLESTFEERRQPDIVEENLSVPKANGLTKEEVFNKQIGPEIPIEDQVSMSQKHATLLMDEASSVKNPFNLDDDKNDDLFELPTDSCFLEVPNSVELRQQVDSTSLMIEQPTVSNLTRMAEVQQCPNSNEHILSTSSAIENGEVISLEDTSVSSSDLLNKTCLTENGMQEDGHTSGINFVPSQATSTEFSTVCMQDISAVSAQAKENMQAKDANAKEMTGVRSIDGIVMEQATSPTAKDAHEANVEEKKPTEGSAAEVNEVHHLDRIEEKQAGSTEASSVQSMGIVEENKQAQGTNAKEMNAQFNADDVKDETQTDGTSAEKTNTSGGTDDSEEKMVAHNTTAKEVTAEQSTDHVEEKQQPNGTVGQEGNNTKQNEEIAAPAARSGRVHVPLKVLLAEASAENPVNQVKKPSTKERVLSFRRRVSKDGNSAARSGSPDADSDAHHWGSPAKLPRKDVGKSSKARKQPWMPFICCHSVH